MKARKVSPGSTRPAAKKGLTTGRRDSLRSMAQHGQGWDELEDWERDEWWKRARCIRIRVRHTRIVNGRPKPRTRTMRGQELYVSINRVLELCGYERCRLPPPPPNFRGNPVKPELEIFWVQQRLAIRVKLHAVPLTDIMVFGSPPRRAGQGPGGNYAFLGLLPASKDGKSEIGVVIQTVEEGS